MSTHPHTSKVDAESDIASSMRVSVLSGSLPMRQSSANTTTTTTTSFRDRDNGLASSASSARSAVRRSSDSYASAMSGNTLRRSNGGMSPARMIVNETRASDGGSSGRTMELKDRPDSKFTPSNSSLVGSRRTHSPSSCCSLLFSSLMCWKRGWRKKRMRMRMKSV